MSQRTKTLIILAWICVTASSLRAVTLEDAAHSVVTSSPLNEASVATMDANIQALAPTVNLANPEIEFENLWGAPGTKMTIGVSQPFDWPGVYSQRTKVAAAKRQEAIAENYFNYRQLMWQAEDLLIQAYYQLQSIELLKVMSQNVDRLHRTYQRSYELGEGTKLDVKKIQIQQLDIDAMLDECQVEYTRIVGELKQLNPEIDFAQLLQSLTLATPQLPSTEIFSYVNHPAILLAQAQSTAAEANVELQRRENLPAFNIGYRYNREIGDNFHGLSASMTLPLWGNRNKTKAATAEWNASQVRLDATAKRISGEIEQLWATANKLQNRLNAYHKVLDDDSIMHMLDMALKGGEMTLMEYLQEVDFFIEAQIKMIATERDLQININQLNRYAKHLS
ncbi:MAG: TolC family protein [Muribaculaceae bacterium]|nr:TolC family protein [Muribaculaceae bacterium]